MSIDKEIKENRQRIVNLLIKTEDELADALLRGDFERVASSSYMVTEYESMLEEFDQYHDSNN